jgi:uncharacterized membrane protein YkvA (DUF1232 family)
MSNNFCSQCGTALEAGVQFCPGCGQSAQSHKGHAKYQKHYSEESFWKKLGKHALRAGKTLVEKALQLFYVVQDPSAPKWAKGVALGALGYFISPIDAIPDFIPVVGYSDDLGVIVATLLTLNACITPEIKKKAQEKLANWFG